MVYFHRMERERSDRPLFSIPGCRLGGNHDTLFYATIGPQVTAGLTNSGSLFSDPCAECKHALRVDFSVTQESTGWKALDHAVTLVTT